MIIFFVNARNTKYMYMGNLHWIHGSTIETKTSNRSLRLKLTTEKDIKERTRTN